MNSPLKINGISKKAVILLLVVSLLLIPSLGLASYHIIGDLAPAPTPPPPPEAPGNLAPIPEPEEPEAPGDLAPVPETEEPEAPGDLAPIPETSDDEDPESTGESDEEVLEEGELILEKDEPETDAEVVITDVKQVNIWALILGFLVIIALIWFLIKRRREASSNE
jgi:LPXTG-motif cell wall-anchored protein